MAEGAVLVAVYPCTPGGCDAAARAFVQELVESITASGLVDTDYQRDETDTEALLSAAIPHHVAGKRYPRTLPRHLAHWYVYVPDIGHCIAVIPAAAMLSGDPSIGDLTLLVTPVPVRTARRLDCATHRGFVVCPVDYDPELGAIYDEHDREW